MHLNERKFEHVEMRIIRQNIQNIQTTCNIYAISKPISRFNFLYYYIFRKIQISVSIRNLAIKIN